MQTLREILTPVADLWSDAVEIWLSGGWAMWAIAAVAVLLFGMGMHIRGTLRQKAFHGVDETTWRRWIDHPAERRGPIGALLDFVSGGRTAADTAHSFGQLRTTELAPFDRDLLVMKICVSAAPLVGLLGTVTGMLSTFGALAAGSGGDQTMGMVAAGISEALVTTETGLVIALPGLLFQSILSRRIERYRVFLAHMETVCTQVLHRRDVVASQVQLRAAATRQIADQLRAALDAEGSAQSVREDRPASLREVSLLH